jgi:hypothetical protein
MIVTNNELCEDKSNPSTYLSIITYDDEQNNIQRYTEFNEEPKNKITVDPQIDLSIETEDITLPEPTITRDGSLSNNKYNPNIRKEKTCGTCKRYQIKYNPLVLKVCRCKCCKELKVDIDICESKVIINMDKDFARFTVFLPCSGKLDGTIYTTDALNCLLEILELIKIDC